MSQTDETSQPDVEMLRHTDGSWVLEARDVGRLRSGLGPDLLLAFCTCFVHENRLLTFAHYRDLIRKHALDERVSLERAKATMLWFEVGTIRELGESIGELRKVLKQRGWLNAPGFDVLNDVEVRWRSLERHRNQAAFHVDPDVIALGLSRMDNWKLLMLGDGASHHQSWMAVGDLALMQGMHKSQDEASALVHQVVTDREAILLASLSLFTHCVKRAGLSHRVRAVDEKA